MVAKYAAARLLTRMDRWYRGSEVLRAGLGLPVERDPEGEFLSHKGYDHRLTRRQLRDRFRLEAEVYSPIRLLGPVLNSQVLWRFGAPGTLGGDRRRRICGGRRLRALLPVHRTGPIGAPGLPRCRGPLFRPRPGRIGAVTVAGMGFKVFGVPPRPVAIGNGRIAQGG